MKDIQKPWLKIPRQAAEVSRKLCSYKSEGKVLRITVSHTIEVGDFVMSQICSSLFLTNPHRHLFCSSPLINSSQLASQLFSPRLTFSQLLSTLLTPSELFSPFLTLLCSPHLLSTLLASSVSQLSARFTFNVKLS